MKVYRGIALVIAACVVLQAALIAFGWFDVLADVDDGAVFDENTDFNAGQIGHGMVGMVVIPLLSIALLITSFFAKTVGASKRALMVFGAVVLQIVLAFVGFGVAAVGALHGLNAFVILGAALYAARLAALAPTPAGASRETSSV